MPFLVAALAFAAACTGDTGNSQSTAGNGTFSAGSGATPDTRAAGVSAPAPPDATRNAPMATTPTQAPPGPGARPEGPAASDQAGRAADADQAGRAADADEADAGTPAQTPPAEKPSFEADGAPLTGTNGTWTFIEFPDTQCRDGSPAGLFLNLGTSKKLMIYLEGGGRCANEETCATLNPANVAAGDLIRGVASAGVFDRRKADNPVRDWSFVVVAYCTGDRHGGANPDGNVARVGPQKFVGYSNMKKFLNRIVPTFRDATDVLLTGISAGGFGVAYNAALVQRAFPSLKIKLIIDSAPFVSKAVFTECDQRATRELYKAEQTFLGECAAACPNPNDYWLDYGRFFAKTFGDRPWGLISTTEDAVERTFFGIGADDCTAPLDLLNPPISAATYRSELLALRSTLASSAGFTTFYPDTDTHTFLAFDELYTVTAGDVRLLDWVTQIVNGRRPEHAGP